MYSGDVEKAYAEYADENQVELIKQAVERQLSAPVKYFTDNEVLRDDVFNEVLEYAQKKKTMEIVAILLDYRNKRGSIDAFSRYEL